MAEKKTTKKAKSTPKNKVNLVKKLEDLRTKEVAELHKVLAESKKDLLEARKSLAANEMANPKAINKMRKEIARINTIIAEKVKLGKSNNDKKEEK